MIITLPEKIYGLSEGVFKACLFLGLKFPPPISKEIQSEQEHVPSDYFGDDFELDEALKEKLCSEKNWSKDKFNKIYEIFSNKYLLQKCFQKHTKTDLNVFFCDYLLFISKHSKVTVNDYFGFEFYRKSLSVQKTFITEEYNAHIRDVCNEYVLARRLNAKSKANEIFADFLHRDWIYAFKCTFDEFKNFAEKHPRFLIKPNGASFGLGVKIVNINSNDKLEKIFASIKAEKSIAEEIINQHEEIAAFCPDTVNTIRVNTILDIHNFVHILTASGRFGRINEVIDNFRGGGFSVTIDPKTGVITSNGLNSVHERVEKHPDTGKVFKGFQYPYWDKLCETVTKMAKMIPQMHRVAWDISINDENEIVLVELNVLLPGIEIQQAPDDTGRLHLYEPLIKELQNYKQQEMQLLGYRVNNIPNFYSAYESALSRRKSRLKFALDKLMPDCSTLMDLGCRTKKLLKELCPGNIIYCPVDFKKHDDEVVACDFNNGEFPDVTTDAILCALTAEYVELLPQFLANMCKIAQKQILMLCRPIDKEAFDFYRWKNPFLVDFTEKFLIETMKKNNFELDEQYPDTRVSSIILYDFRRIIEQ